MNKRKLAKKLTLKKETLGNLDNEALKKANGQAEAEIGSWNSDCNFTCGPNSCLRVCTLNCSWLCLDDAA